MSIISCDCLILMQSIFSLISYASLACKHSIIEPQVSSKVISVQNVIETASQVLVFVDEKLSCDSRLDNVEFDIYILRNLK